MTTPTPEGVRTAEGSGRLSRSVIAAYCLPMVGVGFMGMPFSVWLMKYSTDVLLIAPAAFGVLFFIGRVWDAISDPIAGYLSDRSTARRGRRRSWMRAAAIPLALTTVMLWSPPEMLDGLMLVVWMGAALLLYETASTAFFVPYGALGMELSEQYHERTRLFGYRYAIAGVGFLLGLAAVWLMRTSAEGPDGNPRAVAFYVSLGGGVLMAATILFSARVLPEREDYRGRGATNIFKAFLDVLRNPYGRLLFVVYGIETFGMASIGMLAPYVMQYVLQAPGLTELLVALYFLPPLFLPPVWIWLARRFSKKSLWISSMLVLALGFLSIFFISGSDSELLFVVIFFLGIGGGCGAVVAPSIQADVIDYDEYLTGERKEGAYTAIWNFVRKAAAGITALVTGFALEASGYVPNAADQTEEVKTMMLALMGLLPAACYAIGAVLFLRFSLNEAEHGRVVAVLRERAADRSAKGPASSESGEA